MNSLSFNADHIGKREKERGLLSFEVTPITDPFNMPPNFYPCMETDPIKAQQEAYWAMHMPDHNYNIALHFGLARSIPSPDFTRIEDALNALPPCIQAIDLKGHINKAADFERKIGDYLKDAGHKISPADTLWLGYGQHVTQSFAEGFTDSGVHYLRYGANRGRHQTGLPALDTHVHKHRTPFTILGLGQISAQTTSVMKLDPHHNTLLADSRDICEGSHTLKYAYNKESIVLHEAPPLVPISFKTAGAPHTLGVHGTFVNKDHTSMNRCVWGIFTDYNEASMARAYKNQYESVAEHIQAQDFHRRNLELV